MIKAVLFDMDGVLIDTEKYLTQFWQMAAAEAGLSLTMEDCYQFRSFASTEKNMIIFQFVHEEKN